MFRTHIITSQSIRKIFKTIGLVKEKYRSEEPSGVPCVTLIMDERVFFSIIVWSKVCIWMEGWPEELIRG